MQPRPHLSDLRLFAEAGLNSTALYYDTGRREFACNDGVEYAEGDRVELFGKAYTVTWVGLAEVEAQRRASAPKFDAALIAKLASANARIAAAFGRVA